MEDQAEYKVQKKPKRDKLTIIGTLFLIAFGALVFIAFGLMMWNIYNAIWHG